MAEMADESRDGEGESAALQELLRLRSNPTTGDDRLRRGVRASDRITPATPNALPAKDAPRQERGSRQIRAHTGDGGALLVCRSCCRDHVQVAHGIAVVLPFLLQDRA